MKSTEEYAALGNTHEIVRQVKADRDTDWRRIFDAQVAKATETRAAAQVEAIRTERDEVWAADIERAELKVARATMALERAIAEKTISQAEAYKNGFNEGQKAAGAVPIRKTVVRDAAGRITGLVEAPDE
jgi:hypothetical protein